MSTFAAIKDPAGVLDYRIDWTSWLDGDQITTSTWTADTGITIDNSSNDTKFATVWLSGGTAGVSYGVVNHIVTGGGRTDERTIRIDVRDK